MQPEDSSKIVPALQQAFEAFNESAHRLSLAYAELERKSDRVNQELEQTNQELQRNLEEKRRLHHYLASILDSMGTGVVVFDLDGTITLFNRKAEELTGLTADEAVGQVCHAVFGDIDYHEPTEKSYHDKIPSWLPPDSEVRLDLHTNLVRDAQGQTLGVLLLMDDISERKQLEEQVGRANTLAALGRMAAEVVHEIRNPLAAMQLYVGMLQQELTGEQRRLADDLMVGIRSLEVISGNLLSLTRSVQPRFGTTDLTEAIENALEFSIYAAEEQDIELIRDYPLEGLFCEADFEQLKQVALNLILNAIQSMLDGGTLRISATESPSALVWSIEDTGCGIAPEDQDKIFTPFFSKRASGTGLGLHAVERILEKHNASIEVDSEVGEGTTFTIRLPIKQP